MADKVLIIGPQGSGKTALLNCFEGIPDTDVGICRKYKGKDSDIDYWDLKDDGRQHMYYRNAKVALIVVPLNLEPENFKNQFRKQYKALMGHFLGKKPPSIILVGSKSDVKEEGIERVCTELQDAYSDIGYIECSAKEKKDIEALQDLVADKLQPKKKKQENIDLLLQRMEGRMHAVFQQSQQTLQTYIEAFKAALKLDTRADPDQEQLNNVVKAMSDFLEACESEAKTKSEALVKKCQAVLTALQALDPEKFKATRTAGENLLRKISYWLMAAGLVTFGTATLIGLGLLAGTEITYRKRKQKVQQQRTKDSENLSLELKEFARKPSPTARKPPK